MALNKITAKAAAPVPITSATPVSSHTLRSTVKSRNADGREIIEPPRQCHCAHAVRYAPSPMPIAVPVRSTLAHDCPLACPEPACLCESLAILPAVCRLCPMFSPAGLRVPIDRQVRQYCCASAQVDRPHTQSSLPHSQVHQPPAAKVDAAAGEVLLAPPVSYTHLTLPTK